MADDFKVTENFGFLKFESDLSNVLARYDPQYRDRVLQMFEDEKKHREEMELLRRQHELFLKRSEKLFGLFALSALSAVFVFGLYRWITG